MATLVIPGAPVGIGVRWSQTALVTFSDGTGDGVAATVKIAEIPANVRCLRVRCEVGTAFDGTTDLCSVGHSGDVDSFMDTTLLDISSAALLDSLSDAQPDSGVDGRAPQSAAYDLNAYLETNSNTTAGSAYFIVDLMNENA